MSHMSATCAHGVTFQSFTVPTMYDYCAVQMLSGNAINNANRIKIRS